MHRVRPVEAASFIYDLQLFDVAVPRTAEHRLILWRYVDPSEWFMADLAAVLALAVYLTYCLCLPGELHLWCEFAFYGYELVCALTGYLSYCRSVIARLFWSSRVSCVVCVHSTALPVIVGTQAAALMCDLCAVHWLWSWCTFLHRALVEN